MSHVARSWCAPLTDLRLLGRHQVAAAIATSADFATMVALVEIAGLPPPVATIPSAIAGGLVNLTVARAWSFRRRHRGTIATQAVRYAAVSLGGALMNATFLAVFLNVADVPYPAARAAVAIVVSLLYTYPLHTRFVFRVGTRAGRQGRAMNALGRLVAHQQRLWPRGAFRPIAPFVAYALYSFARSDLRAEHVIVLLLVAGLAYVGPRTKELALGLYPVALVFILYDGMRPFQRIGLTESRVLLCDLRAVEARFFGSGGVTLHDYWQAHHTTTLDLLCAVPYATFILWSVAGGLYLYVKDRLAMKRFMWGFLLLNVAGFVTYHVLPAAPPWYYHAHGCTVDLATKASEGPALARVDTFLGIPYFHGMYGKASSVFGALPSLHCAYPLLLVLEGWRTFGPRLRALSVAYWLAMVFAAIYLDHHWVLDALLGTAYAFVAAGIVRAVGRARERVLTQSEAT